MQTTLLTLAVALILALVAALVGPFFVDWGAYRTVFEKEASRLTGLDIRVHGDIEAKLLPSPRLTMYGVEVGEGDRLMRAGSVALEFALGPLMRGEWRASDVEIKTPRITLAVDKSGQVAAPAFTLTFNPDALSIDHLSISDGTVTVADAGSGATLEADKLWFNGELRSLVGPLKGEGAATVGGDLYPFRISTGRVNDDGALRVHVNVDPVNKPLNIEADGLLSAAGGQPQFQGTWSLAHPVGLAMRTASAAPVTPPWRLGGKLKLTPAAALMEQVDFQYGSDANALKLTGTAELRFGARPRFDGVLSARQIDFDRLAGEDEAKHAPPAATLRRLASLAGQAFKPVMPIRIGLGIDTVTLGGADLQSVRGDVSAANGGWTLDRFEFRAPGLSDVKLSGHLSFENSGPVFRGPAEVRSNKPNALAAWLEGRKDVARASPRPLQLRGDVTLSNEKVAVEQLNASFDSGTIAGRFAYAFGTGKTGANLDASLTSPELDLDAANAFVKAIAAGSTVERPAHVSLSLDIGHASFGGYEAGKTVARLQYNADGLNIEQLAVDDFGGANIRVKGRIATTPTPRGALALDLDASNLSGVNALLARFMPGVAARLRGALASLAPAKLHASLSVADAATNAATVAVKGTAGAMRVAFDGSARGDVRTPSAAAITIDGRLESDDGSVLASLFGLGRAIAVGKKPGRATLKASGSALGEWRVDGAFAADGLDFKANGYAEVVPGRAPAFDVKLGVNKAILALPNGSTELAGTADVALSGDVLKVTAIDGRVAGSPLRGHLLAALKDPVDVSGALDMGDVNLAALTSLALGGPSSSTASTASWNWPAQPFGDAALSAFEAAIAIHALRASLVPPLVVRDFSGDFRLGDGEVTIDKVTGTLAGGAVTGSVAFKRGADGVDASGKVTLAKARVSALLPPSARPPVTGNLSLELSLQGSGRSPVALIGSLHGGGSVALDGAQFAGLDPRAFGAITRAVDQGLQIDAAKVGDLASRALDSGQLSVGHVQGNVTVSAGQVRLEKTRAQGDGAEAAADGVLDLTNGVMDARLVLTGEESAAGTRPDIFVALRGPLTSPAKSIDASALAGWLTLRAVDRESKRLEEAEAARRAMEAARPQIPPPGPALPPTVTPVKPQPEPAPANAPLHDASPPAAPPKPKQTQTPKNPLPHRVERAPSLPAPINILPPVNPPPLPPQGASVNP